MDPVQPPQKWSPMPVIFLDEARRTSSLTLQRKGPEYLFAPGTRHADTYQFDRLACPAQ